MLEQAKGKMRSWIEYIKKYRFTAIILILGIVFMCLPLNIKEEEGESAQETQINRDEHVEKFQKDLEIILSQIDGIGGVSVLLSMESSFEHSYQQNTHVKASDQAEERETETAVVSREGNDVPVELKVTYPTYRGAVVVCQGADKASVKLAVVKAVSSLTGLNTEHITVIKMKGR